MAVKFVVMTGVPKTKERANKERLKWKVPVANHKPLFNQSLTNDLTFHDVHSKPFHLRRVQAKAGPLLVGRDHLGSVLRNVDGVGMARQTVIVQSHADVVADGQLGRGASSKLFESELIR